MENDEEINRGIDYLSERYGLRYEKALFNEAKNEAEKYGGLTIEELESKASEVESRERRLENMGVYGNREEAKGNWYRN